MSDITVADVLKRFAAKVTTPSVKERVQICDSVVKCIPREEFTDAAVRGVIRLLVLTLGRYRDRRSRAAVHNVIVQLATLRAQPTCQTLVSVLAEFAAQQVKLPPCVSSSSESLTALSWLCSVACLCYKSSDDMKHDDFTRLVSFCQLATTKTTTITAYSFLSYRNLVLAAYLGFCTTHDSFNTYS